MTYKRGATLILLFLAICLSGALVSVAHAKITASKQMDEMQDGSAIPAIGLTGDPYLAEVFAANAAPVPTDGATDGAGQQPPTEPAAPEDKDIKALISDRLNYVQDNYPRYLAYLQEHPDYTYGRIVAEVNMNLDRAFYTEIQTIEDPDDILVLVNKYNKLPDGYVPKAYDPDDGRVLKMRDEAQEHFELMKLDAESSGANLWICSGYRSYGVQKALYAAQKRNNPNYYDLYQAREGHSEHQTGLAADFNSTAASFQYTKEYKWLVENAHKYGFVLRYAADKKQITGYAFEPWHWRYVGVHAAEIMKKENLCFEEYHAVYMAGAQNPAAEPAAEPVAEPVAEPAAEPVAEPAAEPVAEPAPTAEPAPSATPAKPSSAGKPVTDLKINRRLN